MTLEEQINSYEGKVQYLHTLKQNLANGSPLTAGQRILAKQFLTTHAIEADNKALLPQQHIHEFKINWDKYKNKMPFDFQKTGINWLMNKQYGILGDEQGLGKTTQAIVAALENNHKKILIICPSTLKYNWKEEIKAYDKEENIHVCSSKDFSTKKKWTIVNYDLLQKVETELKKKKFDLLICDEAHYAKSTASIRAKSTKRIATSCARVWLLTGTPIANRPIDFYQLLKITRHELSKDKQFFVRKFCGGIQTFWGYDTRGASNLKELHYKTQDIILRRKKEDCLDLPEKILTPVYLEVSNFKDYEKAPEVRMNERYEDSLDPTSEDFGKDMEFGSEFVYLAAWRKFCASEKLKDGSTLNLVQNALDNEEKVIVFSSYLDVIDQLKEKLGDIAITIDGRVPVEERQNRVNQFQNDSKIRVIICNIAVAAVGLTLTAASHVIFNDLPWSPAALAQAMDRAHRIGTKKNVNVYFPVYLKTIDEIMLKSLQEKIHNINEAIEGRAGNGLFDTDIRKEVYKQLKK